MKFIDKLGDYIFSEKFEVVLGTITITWLIVLVIAQIAIKVFGPLG